jgi:hypothetical protein
MITFPEIELDNLHSNRYNVTFATVKETLKDSWNVISSSFNFINNLNQPKPSKIGISNDLCLYLYFKNKLVNRCNVYV